MLPFFDNLPAEGWFGKAQGKSLGQDIEKINGDHEPLEERYNRLMTFGRDCPGAVWVTYIGLDPKLAEDHHQETVRAALQSRSSIGGVQPKLLGVIDHGKLRPAKYWESSTHIIKLPCDEMPRIMENEYMSIQATKILLPDDETVNAKLADLYLRNGAVREVLAIERFDRTSEKGRKHFEEVNQLLGFANADRYEGAYFEIANLVREKIGHEGVKQLYARIVTQFLLGNVDNHFKNFSLMKEGDKWSLTPNYDLAPGVMYNKNELALLVKNGNGVMPKPRIVHEKASAGDLTSDAQHLEDAKNVKDLPILKRGTRYEFRDIDAKKVVMLGREFQISLEDIEKIVSQIQDKIPDAKKAIMHDANERLTRDDREKFCAMLDKHNQKLFGGINKFIAVSKTKSSEPHL